jgi:uncharacterized protein
MRRDGTDAEPSIDEILASIRRILADMPPVPIQDEAFELPALFRPTQAQPVDPLPPQIGTAIPSGYSIDWETPAHRHNRRTAASLQPYADSPPIGTATGPKWWTGRPAPLPLTRDAGAIDGESTAPSGYQARSSASPPPLPPSPKSEAPDVPRHMTGCKDTLLAGRMGRSRAEMSLADLLQEGLLAAGRDEAAIAPVEFRAKDTPTAAGGSGQTSAEPQVEMRQSTAAQGVVDQASVALLRPLLKQWLDANIQNVLERLLKEEIERANRKG